jgi:asparagine synthase (glutamine-hydrolysing)
VPLGLWMRGPLRGALEDRLASETVARVGLFEAGTMRRLVAEHLSGARDHQKILWSLLMFDAWRERYLPGVRWD